MRYLPGTLRDYMKYAGKKNKLVGYTKFDLGESEIDGRITIGESFSL